MFNQKKFSILIITLILSLFFAQSVQAGNVFVFSNNLQIGKTSAEVKELQKFLNNNGFVLNKTGVGSAGQETNFFGSATRNALIRFQKANKIVPAIGYFGPITRNAVNKIGAKSNQLENKVQDSKPVSQNDNQVLSRAENNYYTVSGGISGIVGPVILQNNGGDDLIIDINQDSNFIFPTALISGANYNVTAKSKNPGQTCYADNNVGVINGASVKNVRIACGAKLSYNPFTFIPSSSVTSYSLVYTAGTGGTISGIASQTVSRGSSGSKVVAIPDAGYSFVNWSDGYSNAERTDSSVTANKTVTANFEIDTVAPSALSYDSPNLFIVDTAISTLSPTVTGGVDSYSVSPELPAGLSLNTTNGQITGAPTASTTQSTYTVTATNTGGSTTFEIVIMVDGTVIGANGKIWLDRNLGAKQVATSSTDYLAYGDLFQWGRADDGHQLRNSNTTSTNSLSDNPGHDNFILEPSSPFDWPSSQNNSLWQGESGINNPCPPGFRLPTDSEWEAERASWSFSNGFGALTSPLKLTSAGYRVYNSGAISSVGLYGAYWSSTATSNQSRSLIFTEIASNLSTNYRAYGFSVRCTANSYSVNYNSNESTSGTAPANQTKIHGTTLVLALNSGTLVRTGYTFSGWNTSSDGTGTDYIVGSNYTTNASITLFAKWDPVLAVGNDYQGGKIAYIFQAGDPGYVAGETHGLIAAAANQSTGIIWAKPAYQSAAAGATSTVLGGGSANTDKIITQNGLDDTYAAGKARSYDGGGYSDWYLPSQDELGKLYTNRVAIGGFTNNFYWSSSEVNATLSWHQFFFGGGWDTSNKNATYYVRAIRSF